MLSLSLRPGSAQASDPSVVEGSDVEDPEMQIQIDRNAVARCRKSAAAIADPVQAFVERHSTVSVERSVLRLLGVDGVGPGDAPVPNMIVESLDASELAGGIAIPFGRALVETGLEPRELGDRLANGGARLAQFGGVSKEKARGAIVASARAAFDRILRRRGERNDLVHELPQLPPPLLYMIVASGNIYEDRTAAVAAVRSS
jgi:beta-lysine 5,6-aminomutase alpha subunit